MQRLWKRKTLAFVLSVNMIVMTAAPAFATQNNIKMGDGMTVATNDVYAVTADTDIHTSNIYHINEDSVVISENGDYVIESTSSEITGNTIKVNAGVTANITIDGVNIKKDIFSDGPFELATGATVNLTLKGVNTLQTLNAYSAALQVPRDATLFITEDSSGSLLATSHRGAGIGGGMHGAGGTIHIDGGTVTAQSDFGAGIGGGIYGAGGTIHIGGGTVTAKSSVGAGIGGGMLGAAGTFSTSGGDAFIIANSIRDHSSDDWSGVIFEDDTGLVYGTPTLRTDAEVPVDATLVVGTDATLMVGTGTTLTIDEDAMLQNSGTIKLYGGNLAGSGTLTGNLIEKLSGDTGNYYFMPTPDEITVPDDLVYTGTPIILDSTVCPKTILNRTFTFQTSEWEQTFKNASNTDTTVLDSGEYTLVYTNKENSNLSIEKQFVVAKEDTSTTEGVVVKKDEEENCNFKFGETITVEYVPEIDKNASESAMEPKTAQLYYADSALGTFADEIDGKYTMTYDTSGEGIPMGTVAHGAAGLHIEFAGNKNSKTALVPVTDVTLNKADGVGTVAMTGWMYDEVASNPESDSPDGATATYAYKSNADTSHGPSSEKPSDAGTYTVTASFPETHHYHTNTATADFTIEKAEASQSMTTLATTVSHDGGTGMTIALPQLPDGASYNTPTAGTGSLSLSGLSIEDNVLTYNAPPSTAGETGIVTIPVIDATNYHAYIMTITIVSSAKQSPDISFVNETISKTYGDAAFTNSASSTMQDATITYASAAMNVVTVDEHTGIVTIIGYGTASITATAPETETYTKETATYTVSVAQKALTVTADDKEMYQYGMTTPDASFAYDGFVGDDTIAVLKDNTIAATHEVKNSQEDGVFAIQMTGTATADNYTVKLVDGTLEIIATEMSDVPSEIIAPDKDKPSVGIPLASKPEGVADIADLRLAVYEVTAEDRAKLDTATAAVENFPDSKLNLEINLVNIKNNNEIVEPNGHITICIPYPEGTDGNSTFSVLHLEKGIKPVSVASETISEGLQFTVSNLSPFSIGWTTHNYGDDEDNGGNSYTETEYDFWKKVINEIANAEDGDVIKIDATKYEKMPVTVMKDLEKQNVGIVIEWEGGATITIPAGKTQVSEDNRIYYPLSLLEELYEGVALIKESDDNEEPVYQDKETGETTPVIGEIIEVIEPPTTPEIPKDPTIEIPLEPDVGEDSSIVIPPAQNVEQDPTISIPPDPDVEADASAQNTIERERQHMLMMIGAIALMAIGGGVFILRKKQKNQQNQRG